MRGQTHASASPRGPLGGLRRTALLLAAVSLLAACEHPPGNYATAEYRAAPSAVQHDLYFQPGSSQLAIGEAARVQQVLRSLVLGSEDDILVNLAATGSEVLDLQRAEVARRAVSGTPARIRLIMEPGFSLAVRYPDAALVQVWRYSYVRVICPNNGEDFNDDQWNRREVDMGCTNAINRAAMAAQARDLTDPDSLDSGGAAPAIRAVGAYRAGTEKTRTVTVVE